MLTGYAGVTGPFFSAYRQETKEGARGDDGAHDAFI